MVRHTSHEQVDLTIPPQFNSANPKNTKQITLGDLHSNAIKLIHTLTRHGICRIDPEDYQQLLSLYQKENPTEADKTAFRNCLRTKIKITNTNTLVRLIGDTMADRGKNDLYVLAILDLLHSKNVPVSTLLSNHDIELMLAYEAYKKTNASTLDTRDTIGIIPEQKCSLKALSDSIGDVGKTCSPAIFKKLMDETYLPSVKLIDYSLSNTTPTHITLFTHAPIQLSSIEAAAKALGAAYDGTTPERLAHSIDVINQAFQERLQRGELNTLYDGHSPSPIYSLISDREENLESGSEDIPAEHITFVYGHTNAGVPTRDNIVRLDNQLGKGSHNPPEPDPVFTSNESGSKRQDFLNHQDDFILELTQFKALLQSNARKKIITRSYIQTCDEAVKQYEACFKTHSAAPITPKIFAETCRSEAFNAYIKTLRNLSALRYKLEQQPDLPEETAKHLDKVTHQIQTISAVFEDINKQHPDTALKDVSAALRKESRSHYFYSETVEHFKQWDLTPEKSKIQDKQSAMLCSLLLLNANNPLEKPNIIGEKPEPLRDFDSYLKAILIEGLPDIFASDTQAALAIRITYPNTKEDADDIIQALGLNKGPISLEYFDLEALDRLSKISTPPLSTPLWTVLKTMKNVAPAADLASSTTLSMHHAPAHTYTPSQCTLAEKIRAYKETLLLLSSNQIKTTTEPYVALNIAHSAIKIMGSFYDESLISAKDKQSIQDDFKYILEKSKFFEKQQTSKEARKTAADQKASARCLEIMTDTLGMSDKDIESPRLKHLSKDKKEKAKTEGVPEFMVFQETKTRPLTPSLFLDEFIPVDFTPEYLFSAKLPTQSNPDEVKHALGLTDKNSVLEPKNFNLDALERLYESKKQGNNQCAIWLIFACQHIDTSTRLTEKEKVSYYRKIAAKLDENPYLAQDDKDKLVEMIKNKEMTLSEKLKLEDELKRLERKKPHDSELQAKAAAIKAKLAALVGTTGPGASSLDDDLFLHTSLKAP